MTGGLAYIYDEKGHFDLSCSTDGIDLESIENQQEIKRLYEQI